MPIIYGLKALEQWDEDYIATLPSGEFDWLEYKASEKFANPGWEQDMSKYVSAWANYDGGYIIFGVKNPEPGQPLVIDGGIPLAIKPKLADWLSNVVPQLVEPPLQRLSTCLIPPRQQASRISAGNVLIVIHVPQSDSAPHQALDHKYYQRLDRKLQPLKHRAIQDIAGRRRFPKIRTTILVHPGGGIAEPSVFWKMENLGAALALHWKVIVRFPTKINNNDVTFPEEKIRYCETADGKSFIELRIPQMMGSPLFPASDISRSFKIVPCQHQYPLKPSISDIRVTTFADEIPPFDEVIELKDALQNTPRLLQQRAG
jgi:Putative DNA-binding domain